MILIVTIISVIADNIISNIVSYNNTLFVSLFSFLSIFCLYPLFNKNKKNYYIYSFLLGFLYDLLYTSAIFLNAVIFLLFSFFIKKVYKFSSISILSNTLSTILLIVMYRILSYLILFLINYISFDAFILLKGIYSSLIINVLYSLVLYLIINKRIKRDHQS